jgi:hypothetical protein
MFPAILVNITLNSTPPWQKCMDPSDLVSMYVPGRSSFTGDLLTRT